MSKKIGIYVAMILVLSLVCIVPGAARSSKYAAKVNGVKIKTATLDAAVDNFIESQKMLGVEVKEEDKEDLRKGILEELISAELLYQESKKAELGDLRDKIKEQFENIKKGFESEEEFKNLLKERGISEKDLKEDIKKGLYIKTFLDKDIYSNIIVSEEEKRSEYEKNKDKLDVPEQVKARHILIRAAKDASEEEKEKARSKIDELRKRVVSGEDFAELAKENSEDGSAPNGGDLGYFRKGMMVQPFEDAAFGLEIGGVSEVVETQFGYHIIKLEDRQAVRKLSYEEIENTITGFLLNKHKAEKLDKVVNDLREKAKIEIF